MSHVPCATANSAFLLSRVFRASTSMRAAISAGGCLPSPLSHSSPSFNASALRPTGTWRRWQPWKWRTAPTYWPSTTRVLPSIWASGTTPPCSSFSWRIAAASAVSETATSHCETSPLSRMLSGVLRAPQWTRLKSVIYSKIPDVVSLNGLAS